MPEVAISLATNPELLGSLRKLYADLPPWVQAWIIAEPGAPLPAPPPAFVRSAFDRPALLTELEDTCAAVNATGPDHPWVVHQDPHIVWIGPAHSMLANRQPHPHAEGRLVAFNLGQLPHPHPRMDAFPMAGIFQVSPGRLILNFHKMGVYWRFECPNLRVRGQILAASQIGIRQLQGDGFPHLKESIYPAVAVDVELSANLLMADGTEEEIDLDEEGRPYAEQSITVADHLEATITQELSRLALLRRWHALASAADQARIASFWLGHPHPVLAAAGMVACALLPRDPKPRR
jgi:hypothetical protein